MVLCVQGLYTTPRTGSMPLRIQGHGLLLVPYGGYGTPRTVQRAMVLRRKIAFVPVASQRPWY
eukprot:2447818-Rhodomonas_salina.1